MFTIKEVSEIMGISPHSLRFYDNEGLLPSLTKTESGRRMFSYDDLEWVYNIQCWRATGMPVSEIKRYIQLALEGEHTLDERYEIIMRQRDRAIEEMKAAKQRLKMLEHKVMWYEEIRRGANPDKWRPNMRAIVRKALAKNQQVAVAAKGVCAKLIDKAS